MIRKNTAAKAAVIAAVLSAGVYARCTMDKHVVSALKEVETIRMSRTAFRDTVSARGSIYERGGQWYAAALVDESDISGVAAGQEAQVTGAAFEGAISGTVEAVSDAARSEAGRTIVDVTIRLDGGCGELRGGYTAQCSVFVDQARLLNTLPYDVIRQDDEGEFVYVYDNNKAVRRGIRTGIELSGETEILSGITEQSEVIACPDEVTAGALVRKGSER